MIKVQIVECKWCHRPIHGVLRYGVVQCECSVCADVFTMPVEETLGNTEVQHG